MKDRSYGIIPLKRKEGVMYVLLIQHGGDKGGHWGLPKGHKNPAESDIQAATRELYEETGLNTVMVDESVSFTESYNYTWRQDYIEKRVNYFIGWINEQSLTLQETEIQDAAWLPIDQ